MTADSFHSRCRIEMIWRIFHGSSILRIAVRPRKPAGRPRPICSEDSEPIPKLCSKHSRIREVQFS